MKVIKNKRNYVDYRLDRSENDCFFYDGQSNKFEWIQDHFTDNDDGTVELECCAYSLNESDYWHDKKLVKEIKEFKAYVNKQIKKAV